VGIGWKCLHDQDVCYFAFINNSYWDDQTKKDETGIHAARMKEILNAVV
jgi:hypothetical protein